MTDPPKHLDLQRDRGLTVQWGDGSKSFYPVAYLRRMSPSADARQIREEISRNPLAIVPASGPAPLTALDAELVGNYAVRITFSDGHDTGLYTWRYLREIDPGNNEMASGQTESRSNAGGRP